jgi:putative tryptophan/tyrosine transport system substrate-binding protein
MPLIGFLSSGSQGFDAVRLTGLRRGLNETGYVEGRNLTVEYRWAEDHYDRLPALAAELVRRQVACPGECAWPAIPGPGNRLDGDQIHGGWRRAGRRCGQRD